MKLVANVISLTRILAPYSLYSLNPKVVQTLPLIELVTRGILSNFMWVSKYAFCMNCYLTLWTFMKKRTFNGSSFVKVHLSTLRISNSNVNSRKHFNENFAILVFDITKSSTWGHDRASPKIYMTLRRKQEHFRWNLICSILFHFQRQGMSAVIMIRSKVALEQRRIDGGWWSLKLEVKAIVEVFAWEDTFSGRSEQKIRPFSWPLTQGVKCNSKDKNR